MLLISICVINQVKICKWNLVIEKYGSDGFKKTFKEWMNEHQELRGKNHANLIIDKHLGKNHANLGKDKYVR